MARGKARFTGRYVRRELWMRGKLRRLMAEAIASLIGSPSATSMRWTLKGYYKKIYVEYGLRLVGWPADEIFADLSKITGFLRISRLLILWEAGLMRLERVSLDKHERAAQRPEDVAPSPRHHGLPPKLGRSDLKRRWGSSKIDSAKFPARYVRDGPKSAKWVSAAAEARAAAAMEITGREDPDDPIESYSDC
ncbi:hypothetical protein FKP32DRAFT_1571061 [Trametes sanguinea]|nr:hypothetical protein FKP32DRAFT_1745504 [Trametes sanguinea]KAI9063788.1 hypothetical protein FKP32DRAFT_1571061 [Trametes sanguinea]